MVRIFLHSDWIRKDTEYLSVFRPNAGKYGPEITAYLDNFHAVTLSRLSWTEKFAGLFSGKWNIPINNKEKNFFFNLFSWFIQTIYFFVKSMMKGGTKIISEKYVCAHHKNRRKYNEHFKLLFLQSIYTLSHQIKYLHIEN